MRPESCSSRAAPASSVCRRAAWPIPRARTHDRARTGFASAAPRLPQARARGPWPARSLRLPSPWRPSLRGPKRPCAARARPARRPAARCGSPAARGDDRAGPRLPGQRRSILPQRGDDGLGCLLAELLGAVLRARVEQLARVGRARRRGAARVQVEARRWSTSSVMGHRASGRPRVRRPHQAHSNNDAERASRASCRVYPRCSPIVGSQQEPGARELPPTAKLTLL